MIEIKDIFFVGKRKLMYVSSLHLVSLAHTGVPSDGSRWCPKNSQMTREKRSAGDARSLPVQSIRLRTLRSG